MVKKSIRTAKYKLYPKKWQERILEEGLEEMCEVYNAMNEVRRAWHYKSSANVCHKERWVMREDAGPLVIKIDDYAEKKRKVVVRGQDGGEWEGGSWKTKVNNQFRVPGGWKYVFEKLFKGRKFRLGSTPIYQMGQDRVNRAWTDYFDNLSKWNKGALEKPPRPPKMRRVEEFPGWGYKQTTCWDFRVKNKSYARLHLYGVTDKKNESSWIKMRGGAKEFGPRRNLTISRDRCGTWWAVIGMRVEPKRKSGAKKMSFHWGVAHYLTTSNGDRIENPRIYEQYQKQRAESQRIMSGKPRFCPQCGKELKKEYINKDRYKWYCPVCPPRQNKTDSPWPDPPPQKRCYWGNREVVVSKRYEKQRMKTARISRKSANVRRNFSHQVSHDLVSECDSIAIMEYDVAKLIQKHGNTEWTRSQIKNLNRKVLDVAPATLVQMVEVKAEEAGCEVKKVDPLEKFPVQTCPKCGHQHEMPLEIRVFECPECGWKCERAHNAALNVYKEAF